VIQFLNNGMLPSDFSAGWSSNFVRSVMQSDSHTAYPADILSLRRFR